MANEIARTLRQHTTDAERILWAGLRDLKQIGLHFRRQTPFDRYVADFCCHSAKLIAEFDGDQHGADDAIAYDAERTAYLNSRGYRVLRFANWEVIREPSRVLDAIVHAATPPARLAPTQTTRQTDRLADLPARGRLKIGRSFYLFHLPLAERSENREHAKHRRFATISKCERFSGWGVPGEILRCRAGVTNPHPKRFARTLPLLAPARGRLSITTACSRVSSRSAPLVCCAASAARLPRAFWCYAGG